MNNNQNKYAIVAPMVLAITFSLAIPQLSFAQGADVFALRLSTQPFSSMMCKKIRPEENIRVRIAHHRDLTLRKIPNQFIPHQFEAARKKSYVHELTLQDLTNGFIGQGAIAFTATHAVIFSTTHPQGISREEFLSQLPPEIGSLANQALDTFLRLHPILNAAIDGCRPYPSQVTYGTDDEFDKIEAGRLKYRNLATQYNAQPDAIPRVGHFERGISGGYYDPRTQGKRVSYQAANPLNFFRP